MIAWALYTIAISAALGLAALALERALGLYRRPTRWGWAAAMASSIAIPAVLLVVPRAAPTGAVDVLPPAAIEAPLVGPVADRVREASAPGWPDLEPWLLAAWGMATVLLLGHFGRSAWRLSEARRRWASAEVAGEPVLESESLGPAVVGVLNTRIAIPSWIRDLDEDLQRLVVAHERAHQAAADPLLLWLGVAACVAVPWCAPLWWQLRRLRLAIEVDCDRRVLAGGASLARYGALLLEVGRRSSGRPFALVGLFEPRSFLERRIRVMTTTTPPRRFAFALLSILAFVSSAGAAAVLPVPDPALVASPEPDPGSAADTTRTIHFLVTVSAEHGVDLGLDELSGITEGRTHPDTWRRIVDRGVASPGQSCTIRYDDGVPALKILGEDTGGGTGGPAAACFVVEAEVGPDSPKLRPGYPMTLGLQSGYRHVSSVEDLYEAGYSNDVHDVRGMVLYRKELLDERNELGCGVRVEGDVHVFTLTIGERPTGPNYVPWDPDAPPGVCLYLVPEGWDPARVRFERRERPSSSSGAADASEAPATTSTVVDTPPRFQVTRFDERPRCVERCDPLEILTELRRAGVTEGRCEAVIGIRIGAGGTVTASDVLKSENAACDAGLRTWAESTRWNPARRGGEPVVAWIAQPVNAVFGAATDGSGGGEDLETDPDAIARRELRLAMTAQEAYRSRTGDYADRARALSAEFDPVVSVEIRGGGEEYEAIVRHPRATTPYCANSEEGRIVPGEEC